jgi:hypothetical protein
MPILSMQAISSSRLRVALFAALAVVLVWEVTSRSVVAYLANADAGRALHIRSHQSTALLNLVQEKLNIEREKQAATSPSTAAGDNAGPATDEPANAGPASTGPSNNLFSAASLAQAFEGFKGPGQQNPGGGGPIQSGESGGSPGTEKPSRPNPEADANNQTRAMAERALLEDPLNARALRVLGQIADGSNDEPRAWRFMRASARLSLNETFAVFWLMRKSAEKREYGTAMYYADVLLRTRPQLIGYAMPILAQIAEDKEASGGLKRLLSDNPPWRAQFFDALPNGISDARTPLDLLLAVRDSRVPPTSADLRTYLNFLIGHKFYALAYYTWLQFLPAEQLNGLGLVFNGGFETVPSGLPFDWMITPGAGVTIDIGPTPDRDRERALSVGFEDGRVEFHGITELIVLAPASYRFEAKYKGTLLSARGLKWRVTCAGRETESIGESDMVRGIASTWKDIEFSFAVPGADCPAQYLRLDLEARMASEQFISGTVWFDDLQISRIGDTTTGQLH